MPTGRDSVLFANNSVDFSRFSVDPDEAWLEQPLFAAQLRPPMGFPIGTVGSRGPPTSASSAPARLVSATNFSAAVSTSATQAIVATSGGCSKASATNELTDLSTAGRRNGQTAVSIC